MQSSVAILNSPKGIVAAIGVGVTGSLALPFLPMTVGALTDNLELTPQQVGFVVSSDMAGMILANLAALWWIRRVDWRKLALCFALLLLFSHTVSTQAETFELLVIMRLLAGFAGGSMMAIGSTTLGDTSNPERNIAFSIATHSIIAACGLLFMPAMIQRFGVAGVFGTMAALALPVFLFLPWLSRQGRWRGTVKRGITPSISRHAILIALLVTLPGFLFHVGYAATWAYMERIGVNLGLSLTMVGSAISLSMIVALFGSLTASVIGLRWGRVIPFAVTIVLQLIALYILGFRLSGYTTYLAALLLYAFCINFPIPYQVGLAVKMDQTGRATVMYLLMLKAGVAIAPPIAAVFVRNGNFLPVIVMGALFYTASFMLLLGIIYYSTRPGRSNLLPSRG